MSNKTSGESKKEVKAKRSSAVDKSDKQLILQEIETWRKSRLLPAEYCDFLSNLYAEGEPWEASRSQNHWRPMIEWKQLLFSLAGSALLFLLVLHFTSFPSWMQIGLLVFSTILFYLLAFRVSLPISYLRVVFLTAASLLVAVDGYLIVKNLQLLESSVWSLGIFILVLLIWIVTGAAGESRLIVTAAWIGIGVLYEFALYYMRRIGFAAYASNSMYWVIFAAVSMSLGIFLGRSRLFIAPVWAVAAIFALLVPEFLFLLSGSKPFFLIDAIAFLKISLIVSVMIVFRDGIQNWLDSFRMN